MPSTGFGFQVAGFLALGAVFFLAADFLVAFFFVFAFFAFFAMARNVTQGESRGQLAGDS